MRKSLGNRLAAVVADVQPPQLVGIAKDRDPIEFMENPSSGLGMSFYPVQRVILKAHYGVPLDTIKKFEISNFDRKTGIRQLTEADYLKYIADQGRCNIDTVIPGKELRTMVLSLGRRSGKTTITSCVVSYETYRLIQKQNPQKYYGIQDIIQLASIATGKDQAKILFGNVSTHFKKCQFFKPYLANDTQQYVYVQTPQDIIDYGRYADNEKAKASIKVTFLPSSAKGIRGSGNLVIVLDEVAFFQEKGGASAEEIYQAVRPSQAAFSPKLGDGVLRESEGRMILISSPAGKQGLFYNNFQIGMKRQPGSEDMLCVEAPSWEVNPTLTASFLAQERSRDPRIFDQEYGSRFSDRTSGLFDSRKDIIDCIDPTLRKKIIGSSRNVYFAGLDFGYVNDATAIAICHIEGEDIVVDVVDSIQAGVGDHEGLSRLNNDLVMAFVRSYFDRFNIKEGVYDQWAAPVLEGLFEANGLRSLKSERFSPMEKTEIWKTFKSLIWDKKIKLYNSLLLQPFQVGEEVEEDLTDDEEDVGDKDLDSYIRQLLRLQVTYKSKSIWEVAAPRTPGSHDDEADALARAVFLANQQKTAQHIIRGTSSTNQGFLDARQQIGRAHV